MTSYVNKCKEIKEQLKPYLCYDGYSDAINNYTGDDIYNKTYNKLKSKYGDRVVILRDFSKNVAFLIPNNIDFLYIDGNHSYKYVYEDLENFFDKVKMGGFIFGDDANDTDDSQRDENGDVYIEWGADSYGLYGVIKAFCDFFKQKNLPYHIIGNQVAVQKI